MTPTRPAPQATAGPAAAPVSRDFSPLFSGEVWEALQQVNPGLPASSQVKTVRLREVSGLVQREVPSGLQGQWFPGGPFPLGTLVSSSERTPGGSSGRRSVCSAPASWRLTCPPEVLLYYLGVRSGDRRKLWLRALSEGTVGGACSLGPLNGVPLWNPQTMYPNNFSKDVIRAQRPRPYGTLEGPTPADPRPGQCPWGLGDQPTSLGGDIYGT